MEYISLFFLHTEWGLACSPFKKKNGGRWMEYDGWQLYISPDHRGGLDVLVCLALYTTRYTIKYRHTVKRGWVCRSSCWVWICVHPNVWPLRRDLWVWIRRWCPPRWCRRRWTSRIEAQVRTATAGSDPNLSIIQFLDYNHLSKKLSSNQNFKTDTYLSWPICC